MCEWRWGILFMLLLSISINACCGKCVIFYGVVVILVLALLLLLLPLLSFASCKEINLSQFFCS